MEGRSGCLEGWSAQSRDNGKLHRGASVFSVANGTGLPLVVGVRISVWHWGAGLPLVGAPGGCQNICLALGWRQSV